MAEVSYSEIDVEQPEGGVFVPGLLCGCIGLLVSLVLLKLGAFDSLESALVELLVNELRLSQSLVPLSFSILLTAGALYSIVIALVILDSARAWRRIVIAVTSWVVVVAMVASLAVWDIYFSPFIVLSGVIGASFCAVLYSHVHRMPCDALSHRKEADTWPK